MTTYNLQALFGVSISGPTGQERGGYPNKQYIIQTTSIQKHLTTQSIGTAHELISIGDLTDSVMCILENKHATAIVQVGCVVSSTFYPLFDLRPGGVPAIMPIVSSLANVYLKSNTLATDVDVTLLKIVTPV